MSNARNPREKRSFLIFRKNSDLQTVSVVTFAFVVFVILYQLVAGFSTKGGLTYPSFLYPSNILNIFIQNAAVGIMAMGMCTVMLAGASTCRWA